MLPIVWLLSFYFPNQIWLVSWPETIRSHRGTKVGWPDFQPMRVQEEPVCIHLFRQNPVFTSLHLKSRLRSQQACSANSIQKSSLGKTFPTQKLELDSNFFLIYSFSKCSTGMFWMTGLFQTKLSFKLTRQKSLHCTAKNQCRKFETNIPRKWIARPQSQFPHSCVCEQFIYSHNRPANSAAGNTVCGPILRKYKSLTTWTWKLRLRSRNSQKRNI